jgi:general secretion pathway protein D
MLNIRQLCSLLAAVTILWTSVVPAEAKTRKGDKFYNAGQKAELGRDFEKGLEQYELALKEDPGDTAYQMAVRRSRFAAGAGRIDRAQKLREQGKVEEALLEFERAFLIDPSSSLAVQEIRRTKAMLDYQRRQGAALREDERGQTPAQIAKKRSDEKIGTIQGVPELKPLSRQVTSLKMNNQNVKVLYETLGKLTGINVIWDPEYQQPSKNYNVDFTNTNLEEALDHLSVMTKTYWKPLSSNTVFLTNDNITKRRDYEDNVVKVFYLQNITSVQELNEIATSVRSVTEIRRLYTYNAQNAVIARGTVDQVALVEKLLGDLDKPKAEVLVDVIVMETATGRTRDLAATIVTGDSPGLRFSVSPSGTTSTTDSTTSVTTTSGGTRSLGTLRNLNENDFTVNLPGALLQAIMTDRNSKVRQTPQIRAADGQKAQLRIGEKVPTASGSFQPGIGAVGVSPLVNTQFQYLEVGVVMDMVPRIHGDDEISMHVEIEISNVVERIDIGGIKQPVIGQRKVVHDVRIREGEMNLIGGLVKTTSTRNVSGIPGLMQIPWLGRLFSSETVETSNSELVIALVPHIVRTQEITPVNLRGVAAGNDQTVRLLYSSPDGGKAPAATGAAPAAGTLAMPAEQPAAPSKPAVTPAAPVKLTFQPEGVVTRAGSPVVVTVHVGDAVDLFQAPLRIKYDPKKLKMLAATPGAFLSGDGQRVSISTDDQAAKGEVAIQMSRPAGAPGLTGNGALLSLTFQTLEAGQTQISVIDTGLQNAKLQPVPGQKPSIGVEIR